MSKISVLAFSDIHNNVEAVEALRKRERGNFDALVIAGDIGSERAAEILEIASDYDCPVFYIYGNWDNLLSYSQTFSRNCIHLHQETFSVNGYCFAGFSGCPTHWGMNPIAEKLFLNVQNDFAELLQTVHLLEKEIASAAELFIKEAEEAEQEYNAYIEHLMPKIRKSKSETEYHEKLLKTKKRYKNDKKVKEFEKCILLNKKKIAALDKPLDRLLISKKYKNYQDARSRARRIAEGENRRILIEKIQSQGNVFSKTFLIAHERLYKTHIDAPNLFCHLFGHRHGFKHTIYKGTNFINVSALDNDRVTVFDNHRLIRERNSTYCILKAEGANLDVRCEPLNNI